MKVLYALRGVLVVALVTLTHPVCAQVGTLPRTLTQSNTITQENRGEIAAFVNQWLDALTSDDAREIVRARGALGLRQSMRYPGGISPEFRLAYSGIVAPKLAELAVSRNIRGALDGFLIASRIGTDAGMDILIDGIGSDSPLLRNAAAGRAVLAMQDVQSGQSLVSPQLVSTLARETHRAAMEESAGYALQRQIELLDKIHLAATTNVAKFGNLGQEVHRHRIDVLGKQAEELRAGAVDGLTLLIATLRSKFQLAAAGVQVEEGKILAAHLRTLLASAHEDWDEAQQPAAVHLAYGRLIEDAESFLSFIDRSIAQGQTPNTQMKRSWEQKDKPQFEQDLARWNEHLSKDPYNFRQGG